MKIRKSTLKRIIQEEIEKDLLFEKTAVLEEEEESEPDDGFESEAERRERLVKILTNDDPDDDKEVDPDFRRGFFAVYKPGKFVTDSISGNFEEEDEPENEKPEGEPDFVNDIMASYYLFWVKGLTGGVLKGPLGDSPSEIISAGYAIIMAGEGQLDTFQLFSPKYWGKDKELPNVKDFDGNGLSGCEATAMMLVAGSIYKKMYQAYGFLGDKADKVLGARLRTLIGRRRFIAISPGLNAEDVKQILSLALTLKLLRDHEPTANAITKLTEELCNIKDMDSGFRAVERIIVKFIFGTPGFVMDVYKDLIDDLTNASKETEEEDTGDGKNAGDLT